MDKLTYIAEVAKKQAKVDILKKLIYQVLQIFIIDNEPFIIKHSHYPEFEGKAIPINPKMLRRRVIEKIVDMNQAYQGDLSDLNVGEMRLRAIDLVQDYLIDRIMRNDRIEGIIESLIDLPITNAQLIDRNVYVYSNSNIIFVVPADRIMFFTAHSVTVRIGNYDITYDNTGRQVAIVAVSRFQ